MRPESDEIMLAQIPSFENLIEKCETHDDILDLLETDDYHCPFEIVYFGAPVKVCGICDADDLRGDGLVVFHDVEDLVERAVLVVHDPEQLGDYAVERGKDLDGLRLRQHFVAQG
jgi:hypothetical protein